jgi:hypothetical protein
LKNYNFYSKAPTDKNCGDGKICGSEEDDNFFCVGKNDPCPILQISDSSGYEESAEFTSSRIYFTRKGPYLPIVEFRVSEEQVCMKNNRTSISASREDYPLMNEMRTPCTEADSRFIAINFIKETKFYSINEYTYLKDTLSGY